MKNKRRKLHDNLEVVPVGYANGVAPGFPLTDTEKDLMIEEAAEAYGKFLDALKCDWRSDPNSMETPRRVAKAYVLDLWKGRYTPMSEITSFHQMDEPTAGLISELLYCTTRQPINLHHYADARRS